MNRLDNLIRELCPYGVAYTRIADISTVLRGKRLTKNELTIAGAFPVFHGGLEPLGFYSQKNIQKRPYFKIFSWNGWIL